MKGTKINKKRPGLAQKQKNIYPFRWYLICVKQNGFNLWRRWNLPARISSCRWAECRWHVSASAGWSGDVRRWRRCHSVSSSCLSTAVTSCSRRHTCCPESSWATCGRRVESSPWFRLSIQVQLFVRSPTTLFATLTYSLMTTKRCDWPKLYFKKSRIKRIGTRSKSSSFPPTSSRSSTPWRT